ncbi:flagellar motor switch phosphatase FliY [Lachnobacterium bovis]|jgi:flagellar motor switch protein FliN/FliY|uniref:Flagellar motor switch protein FliN/FliY n=1 Tax=Lachnobacterium bovis DSM 14045 TaxID=1122142 RepID=A0A1H3EYG0_9FIRM|nr:flagellar motor switch phosphatase FliY [Lachnobacterium bovis]SDX83577.1 flagellar motor switch protein FliN/FliY [Lachnobacterium bovis DSM 14045]
MDGVLSQDEINALINGGGDSSGSEGGNEPEDTSAEGGGGNTLTEDEKDAIGEISNISMGSAATTLFALVNRKVEISTPIVSYSTWNDIEEDYERPCVFIRIAYTVGLDGSNILVLKERDVKIITDLMMGGDGLNVEGELGELHLSAISEAMNQMMGAASTSLSSMLNRMIDISPPVADLINPQDDVDEASIDEFLTHPFVLIKFRMQIGDLVDSEIMQLYPFEFAREMCKGVSANMEEETQSAAAAQAAPPPAAAPQQAPPQNSQPMGGQPMGQVYNQQPVNVQPAQFQSFSGGQFQQVQPENIDLIMDVPLNVTVELGRTNKTISEILDLSPGKIIELDKIAGEPIDVLVNGKYVAKGEVVVIEESFGVRITEIINTVNPIKNS